MQLYIWLETMMVMYEQLFCLIFGRVNTADFPDQGQKHKTSFTDPSTDAVILQQYYINKYTNFTSEVVKPPLTMINHDNSEGNIT